MVKYGYYKSNTSRPFKDRAKFFELFDNVKNKYEDFKKEFKIFVRTMKYHENKFKNTCFETSLIELLKHEWVNYDEVNPFVAKEMVNDIYENYYHERYNFKNIEMYISEIKDIYNDEKRLNDRVFDAIGRAEELIINFSEAIRDVMDTMKDNLEDDRRFMRSHKSVLHDNNRNNYLKHHRRVPTTIRAKKTAPRKTSKVNKMVGATINKNFGKIF